MRKILIAVILFSTAFFPGIQVNEFAPVENVIAERAVEDFTHVVIAEEMTAEWCVYCPSAAENLMKVGNKIGIIDNQDALIGNPAYDLVSLIDDVRIKTSKKLPQSTNYP